MLDVITLAATLLIVAVRFAIDLARTRPKATE